MSSTNENGIAWWFLLVAVVFFSIIPAARAQTNHAPAAQPQTVVANVDLSKTGTPISKYELGMFIEHIGPLIYRSFWSEMLDDRKFYHSEFNVIRMTAAKSGARPSRRRTCLR